MKLLLVLVCMGSLFLALSPSATVFATSSTYQRKYLNLPLQRRIQGRFPEPFDSCFYNDPISVTTYFDMNGIRGTIQFYQAGRNIPPVTIVVNIDGLNQFPDEMWSWQIHERPINFALLEDEPCSSCFIGDLYDPLNVSSAIDYIETCNEDSANCAVGDFSGRHGPISAGQNFYYFRDYNLDLFEEFSPIGRSIVIRRESGFRFACANINYDARNRIDTYVAPFPFDPKQKVNNIQGEVVLRRPQGRCGVTLDANLFRVDGAPPANLGWSLRRGKPGLNGDCSGLQSDTVYGGATYPILNYEDNCNLHQLNCYAGDLNRKCGPITPSCDDSLQNFCTDTQIARISQSIIDDLSIAIENEFGEIIACSNFSLWQPRTAIANYYGANRISLNAFFYQEDPHDDTVMRAYINGLDPNLCYYLQIRERPVTDTTQDCRNLGPVYEPRYSFNEQLRQSGIIQTGDRDFVGQLQYKLPTLCGDSLHAFIRRNSYIPLFWEYDVVGRALVLHEVFTGEALACATIEEYSGGVSDDLRLSLVGYHY